MRLPNGYGSIVKLKGNRRKPYQIRVYIDDGAGNKIRKCIGYGETYEKAQEILKAFKSNPWDVVEGKETFKDVYKLWLKNTTLSESTKRSYITVYRNYCQPLYDIPYSDLRTFHFIEVINSCNGSPGYKAKFKKLFRQLDRTAMQYNIINKSYAEFIPAQKVESSNRKPFSEEEIKLLWDNLDIKGVDIALILIYTGFRRGEFLELKKENIDFNKKQITGGAKTAAGKNRIVPIHPRIEPLIKMLYNNSNNEKLYGKSSSTLGEVFSHAMKTLGLKHTPHECRHTFRTRLYNEKAGNVEIDLLMGHASSSIGERIYTHVLEEKLRETVLLLK